MTYIAMPRLSDSMEEGTIVSWLVADGATISAEQEIVEIETDKATMTYSADLPGTISIITAEGATVPVGEPIAAIAPHEPPTDGRAAGEAPRSGDRARRWVASPVARRLAEAGGIDLSSLTGTGPGGRIIRADVEAAIAAAAQPHERAQDEVAPLETIAATAEIRSLTRPQQLIAKRMAEAKATIPEFTLQTEVDMEAALGLRERLREQLDGDRSPSVNDLVVKACAIALRRHPRVNASYVGGELHLHRHINIGVAGAAPDLLLVPTIRDADIKTVVAIAEETRALARRARDGAASPGDLDGGTFTISNLGMFGITAVTPILNPPQAAILGVGTTREVLRLIDGQPVAQRIMTLTLTCDHRILYGADAAAFLAELRGVLAEPLRLLV